MDVLLSILSSISLVISSIGILIITWGVILVLIQFLRFQYAFLRKHEGETKDITSLRLTLSIYIMLGLEFLVAGDIITTVLHPSKNDLIILGSIVAIRTVISYFFNKELLEKQAKI